MPSSFVTDEHVPSVFVTTLRSSGHDVIEANDVLGEATDDRRLLRYCGENGHVLVTHDRTDFAGELMDTLDHTGIAVYTDTNFLRDDPESVVRTLEGVLSQYPPDELTNEVVWFEHWR